MKIKAITLILLVICQVGSTQEKLGFAELLKSAETGNADALYEIVTIWNISDDLTETIGSNALEVFEDSANEGNAKSQCALGTMYYLGKAVAKDWAVAREWLKKAAEQGSAEAQFRLGQTYFMDGESNVSRDYDQALKWFRKSASQGFADAQSAIGFMYKEGKGVVQNYSIAFEWFEKAAEQGNTTGQYNVGKMYLMGEGVSEDNMKAHIWLNVVGALADNNRSTTFYQFLSETMAEGFRDIAEEQLSRKQLAEAQRLASEWIEEFKKMSN